MDRQDAHARSIECCSPHLEQFSFSRFWRHERPVNPSPFGSGIRVAPARDEDELFRSHRGHQSAKGWKTPFCFSCPAGATGIDSLAEPAGSRPAARAEFRPVQPRGCPCSPAASAPSSRSRLVAEARAPRPTSALRPERIVSRRRAGRVLCPRARRPRACASATKEGPNNAKTGQVVRHRGFAGIATAVRSSSPNSELSAAAPRRCAKRSTPSRHVAWVRPAWCTRAAGLVRRGSRRGRMWRWQAARGDRAGRRPLRAPAGRNSQLLLRRYRCCRLGHRRAACGNATMRRRRRLCVSSSG